MNYKIIEIQSEQKNEIIVQLIENKKNILNLMQNNFGDWLLKKGEVFDDCIIIPKENEKAIELFDCLKEAYLKTKEDKWIKTESEIQKRVRSEEQKNLVERCCISIREKDNDLFKKIITKIEDLNQKNKHKNTLAMVAAWNNNIYALKTLKKKGAKLDYPEVILFAARNINTLKFLKENNLFNTNILSDFTPLQQACNIKNMATGEIDYSLVPERIQCIQYLIENGAEIDAINVYGRTALMGAVASNSYNLVKELLKYNPNTKIKCKNNKLAIDYAQSKEIEDLLKKHSFKIVK